MQLFVFGNVVSENLSGIYQALNGICIHCRSDEVILCCSGAALVAFAVHCEPVAVLPAVCPETFDSSRVTDVVYPFFHHRIVFAEHFFITVRKVHLPRNYRRTVRPGGRYALRTQAVWNDYRHAAVGAEALLCGTVRKPFAEELFNIEIVCTGAAEHLCVARPAETLVALRTVRRDVEIVASLTPENIVIKLIHFFVAAGKKAGAFHIGINGNGSKAVGVDGFKGIFFEADISVSLKRE